MSKIYSCINVVLILNKYANQSTDSNSNCTKVLTFGQYCLRYSLIQRWVLELPVVIGHSRGISHSCRGRATRELLAIVSPRTGAREITILSFLPGLCPKLPSFLSKDPPVGFTLITYTIIFERWITLLVILVAYKRLYILLCQADTPISFPNKGRLSQFLSKLTNS